MDPFQKEMFDVDQLDLRLYSHIGDVAFEPVYDESIEEVIDHESNEG